MNKAVLRKQLLNRRKSLSPQQMMTQNDAICYHLQSQHFFKLAKTILSYLAFRNEPDLGTLFALSKTWGIPRCKEDQLIWHRYQLGDRLVSGQFDIWEPHPDLPLLDLSTIDVVFVPALACSLRGDRLGYGAGFYDRFLGSLTHRVTTVGIVFECCLVPELPRDPWDVPLDFICTEKQIYQCKLS